MVKELTLPKSDEWMPRFRGWCFLQIISGVSYWQHPDGPREIPAGASLLLTKDAEGGLRASQLSEVAISYFCVEPEKLTGLLSLSEQRSLTLAAAHDHADIRVLPPAHPISERFKNLCLNRTGANVALRLQLLQLFVDLFGSEIEESPADAIQEMDGRVRLRLLLNQMPASEFVELSLSDLEPRVHCSARHLSRLFRQEIGASFREKQTELRLAKACELLAHSNAKMVEVALASGYQSNSIFSQLFKKQFGVSPGKWRQQHVHRNREQRRFLPRLSL
ncbi:MAG: helix-turn-helix transcriptional regulator [Verrucomicrobiota bacterium]